jgi:PAS domain S-box-containing protein
MSATNRPSRRSQRFTLQITLAALVAGLACTGLATLVAWKQVRLEALSRFDRITELVAAETQRRVNQPVYGLKGARGVFAASEHVTRNEFAAYVASRDLESEFPGAVGFGFVERVPPRRLRDFIARERADGAPNFNVKQLPGVKHPPSDADHFIVKYIYPHESNQKAEGIDFRDDPVRREAALRAIASGEPTISGRVTLPQKNSPHSGFLYFVPVYRRGASVETPQARSDALVGLLYAPIALDDALRGVVAAEGDKTDLEVFDGDHLDAQHKLYDHDAHLAEVQGRVERDAYDDRMFIQQTPIDLGGRTWTLVTSTTPAFDRDVSYAGPMMIASGGIVVSSLLSAVVWSLSRGRHLAESRALQMTAELRQSEQRARTAATEADRLAEIARRTSNAVVITDVAGGIEWINEGFTRVTGYSLEEVVGKKPGRVLQGPRSDREVARIMGDAVRRGISASVEIVNYAKNGKEYWVAIELAPLHSATGELSGFMAIQSDITELKASSEQAAAANKAKSEFLANMSHEIRTPLTSILGCCDMLREDGELDRAPPSRLQMIDTIRKAGDHLLTVINDILDLSKIEAGKHHTESVPTSLTALLMEVRDLLQPRADAKNVGLNVVLNSPIPDVITSDPTHIRQILLNLAGNALKFTDAGCVDVAVEAQNGPLGDWIIIDVHDSGPGMTSEQAAMLFQPFTQADASVTRKFGGTGLGLTISRRLAEFLGGRVLLKQTSPGQGSTFSLEFPLVPATGAQMVDSLSAPPKSKRVATPCKIKLSGHILVVEDSPEIQRLLKFYLERAGAKVTLADNGKIAYELYSLSRKTGNEFNLLISDMQMPEIDGYTLASTLRAENAQIPIVALTAHAMAEDRELCLKAGCDTYVSKPVVKEKLLEECDKWLAKSCYYPSCD